MLCELLVGVVGVACGHRLTHCESQVYPDLMHSEDISARQDFPQALMRSLETHLEEQIVRIPVDCLQAHRQQFDNKVVDMLDEFNMFEFGKFWKKQATQKRSGAWRM